MSLKAWTFRIAVKLQTKEEALLHAAAPSPTADRAVLLDRECVGDPAVRARLDTLLASHSRR